jgi:hypothetical protein
MKVVSVRSKDSIQADIDKNRDLIDKALNADMPLDMLYEIIRRLSAKNEKLIKFKDHVG